MSWEDWLLIPLGFVVGAYGTIVGAGGGFVLVPVLLLIYPDEDPAAITSISLAVVFFNALSGSFAYSRVGRIDYRSGLVFAVSALPSAIAGAYLVDLIPRQVFAVMFGCILIGIALYTMWSAGRTETIRPPLHGRFIVRRVMRGAEEGATFQYSYNMLYAVISSAIIGLLSSLLGIGGGVFQVPVMINLLRFPVHIATATSQFVLLFMSGEGSAVHLLHGHIAGQNMVRALLLAAGVMPGAQLGARLARRMRGAAVARLLAAALIIVGGRLLLKVLW